MTKIVKHFTYQKVDYTFCGPEMTPLMNTYGSTKTFYEIRLLDFIAKQNLEGVYIDCGSFVGNHTIFFANHCKSTKVHSVDADQYTLEYFNRHCSDNLIDKSKVTHTLCAVMEKIGFVNMDPPKKRPIVSCLEVNELKVVEQGSVPATTLDILFKDAEEPIVFIKLDIEGCELQALQGAKEILAKHGPMLAAECQTKQEVTALTTYLVTQGYTLHKEIRMGSPMYIYKKA